MNKYKRAIYILSIILTIAVIGGTCTYIFTQKSSKPVYGQFVAPEFERNAQMGTPNLGNIHGYSRFNREDMPYSVCIINQLYFTENRAKVLFTNEGENRAWLRLRVLNENQEIIAETGLLKPGQYLDTVEFQQVPKVGSFVTLKIMGYEPFTYHSVGAISIEGKIGG